MRSIWKGQINFGLVNIPVSAYSATQDDAIHFRQLRQTDLSPINYKKVAQTDGKEVPSDQIVKGFEYERGKYIVLTDDDLDSINIESNKTIAISEFVDPQQIDIKHIEKPYILEADKMSLGAYSLLFKALQDTGKVGIGKVALRNREYLVGIMANKTHLLMMQLRFVTEIKDATEVTAADTKNLQPDMLKLAKQLIAQMSTAKFVPDKYHNEYAVALNELIEAKAKNQPVKKGAKPAAVTQVPNMLEMLKASVQQKGKKAA